MLVLSRREGERVTVNIPGRKNSITFTVIRIVKGGWMRVGVEADKDVIIKREELLNTDAQ